MYFKYIQKNNSDHMYAIIMNKEKNICIYNTDIYYRVIFLVHDYCTRVANI